jgi:hypothetical protein
MQTAEIVIVGSGSLAAGVVNALSQVSSLRLGVAVLGRSQGKVSRLVDIANARAAMFGTAVRFEGQEVREFRAAAFSRVFRSLKPKIIFQTASLQSPWDAGEGENGWTKLVASGGFGITLPLQMALAAEVSQGAEDSDAAVVNASYPDCVNVALHRLGLRVACGIGNAAIVEAFCRAQAGANRDVRVVGHHGHLAPWLTGKRAERKPRVWVKGREIDAPRYVPKLGRIDEELNDVTSSTAFAVLMGLLTGATLHISIPGIRGLPGGYPLRVRRGKFDLRLPPGITVEQAIAHNKTGERSDGLELGEGAKFVGKAREALRSTGFEDWEGFEFAEWAGVRDRMMALKERLRGGNSASLRQ